MFHAPYPKKEKGITLIEIIVVIFITALFSMIAVADFPRIQSQYALSKATYKLEQDIRKAEDLALSGVQAKGANGSLISVKGYGVYFNPGGDNNTQSTTKYVIYADVNGNQKYDGNFLSSLCSSLPASPPVTSDCAMEIIDISQENPNLYIKSVSNIIGAYTSVNFSPPIPTTKIDNIISINSPIGIVLGLKNDSSTTRTVQVNASGLINVQ